LHPFLASRDSKITLLQHELSIMKEDLSSMSAKKSSQAVDEDEADDEAESSEPAAMNGVDLQELDSMVCDYLQSRSSYSLTYLQMKEDMQQGVNGTGKRGNKSLTKIFRHAKSQEDSLAKLAKALEEIELERGVSGGLKEENKKLKSQVRSCGLIF
jgi:hypothetical protein